MFIIIMLMKVKRFIIIMVITMDIIMDINMVIIMVITINMAAMVMVMIVMVGAGMVGQDGDMVVVIMVTVVGDTKDGVMVVTLMPLCHMAGTEVGAMDMEVGDMDGVGGKSKLTTRSDHKFNFNIICNILNSFPL
ncbi:uncharacterized protein LOC128393114 [Panonychus citri]|uniref:uncharacterized protein LOC128393114 n=1 Tax=Panonychus citri TaxID=50023 RepID=UPI002307FE1E|nr:uncharacterized protein LOC128393114 [Panonychus citri]